MLRLRQSPFAKGGRGSLTNKTSEAQVLLAGSTMNTFLEIGEYKWAIGHTKFYTWQLMRD